MNKIFKLSLTLFVIVAGTLLLLAGAGGVRYVGNFTGNGSGLTNIPQAGVVQLSNSLYYLTNAITGAQTNLSNLTVTNGARMTNVTTLGLTNYANLSTYNLHFWDPTQTTWTRLFVDDFTFNFSGLSVSNALFYGDGAGLTSLNGSQITSGTVADARIASTIARDSEVTTATQNSTNAGNIAFLPANNVFTGSNNFSGPVVVDTNLIVTANGNLTALGPSNRVNNLYGDNMNFSGTLSANALVVTNPPALNLQSSTNLFEKNVVVQTNTWGNQVVDFSRGTLLHTNLAGNLTLTGISGFALSNYNWMTVELNPNGATRTLTVPAEWYVNIGTTITNGFTNATVGAIPDGTWAQLQMTAIIGVRTAAVLNILQ